MHLTWSDEKNDRCQECGSETLLVAAFRDMKIAKGADKSFQRRHYDESDDGVVEIQEEISGHYCPRCQKLTSLSLNS